MAPFLRQPATPETKFPNDLSAQPLISPTATLVRTFKLINVVFAHDPLAHAAALNEIVEAYRNRTLDQIQALYDNPHRWSRGFSLRIHSLLRDRQSRSGPLTSLPPSLD